MRKKMKFRAIAAVAALGIMLAACGTEQPTDEGDEALIGGTATEPTDTETGAADAGGDLSSGRQSEWFEEAAFTEQLEQRDAIPEGPDGEPWVQAIDPEMTDTADVVDANEGTVCFSNAGVNNPWRVVGYTTMTEEVELHDSITDFVHVDAAGNDEKQISDIQSLVDGECDVLIVSPNTTAALTPAVEAACEDLPVIVFDRGVNTDCPVTFIKPIGGYAFGADAAEFLVESVPEGGNILALRILPGVDVLETRWVAGQVIMEEAGLNIVGAEFTDGDPAKTKSIVSDYLQRGNIDGVWMDAGATSVAAIEAFEDAGVDVPPITGEDQQDFLLKWSNEGLTAVAPTYPTYQWRTPIIAASRILSDEEIPGGEWTLPQPVITDENLSEYLFPDMPPLFYALCGCQEMPDFPDPWQ